MQPIATDELKNCITLLFGGFAVTRNETELKEQMAAFETVLKKYPAFAILAVFGRLRREGKRFLPPTFELAAAVHAETLNVSLEREEISRILYARIEEKKKSDPARIEAIVKNFREDMASDRIMRSES